MSESATETVSPLCDADTAAPSVGFSPFTFRSPRWRRQHQLPHYKVGAKILFDLREIREWAERHRQQPDSVA
jgi:hypothetical protein